LQHSDKGIVERKAVFIGLVLTRDSATRQDSLGKAGVKEKKPANGDEGGKVWGLSSANKNATTATIEMGEFRMFSITVGEYVMLQAPHRPQHTNAHSDEKDRNATNSGSFPPRPDNATCMEKKTLSLRHGGVSKRPPAGENQRRDSKGSVKSQKRARSRLCLYTYRRAREQAPYQNEQLERKQ